MNDWLAHHGVKGMKWGVRRYQNEDGTWTEEGKLRRRDPAVFVSGSSKTETKGSPYYRKKLPKAITDALDKYMARKTKIIVGDAPGIDRQVQNYLNKAGYKNVDIYGPGKEVRYTANKGWKTHPIDAPEYEPYSKEWLAKKDIAMEEASTEGFAVILDEGSSATRNNIDRLIESNKDVKVYQLNKDGTDGWNNTIQREMLSKKIVDTDLKIMDIVDSYYDHDIKQIDDSLYSDANYIKLINQVDTYKKARSRY